jgi:Type II secretory pathway, component PulF
MPNFTLKVGTPDGQIVKREFHAPDIKEAADEARRHGLHVFHAKRRGFGLESLVPRSRKAISMERFLLFNQELLALVKAGMPILQSFDIMLERQRSTRFREVLTDIRDKIKSGVAISDAFASYGNQFPPIYSTSLRAGERSGDLEGVLRRFLRYQKLIVALRKKVISAMVYPSVIATVSVGMIFIMLTFVIPKFSEFYKGFDAELPLVTRTLIAIAFGVRSNFVMVIAGLIVLVFVIRKWASTGIGGEAFDRFKLMIPLVGGVMHRFSILQFTQSLATLLGGGTPMVPAIEIASQSITNKHISTRVMGIVQNVREGEALWHSLEKTGVMSDLAVEMIKVGESTGSLVEMLSNVSEFYDEEIEAMLARIISLIEPIILVILGCVVASLLYAFYLPLFQLTNVQKD